jgi:hypothetical protein
VDEQDSSFANLFIYLEIEKLLLQFFLSQIEYVCYELSTNNLIRFLKEFKDFINYYEKKGCNFEYLLIEEEEDESTFLDEHLDTKKIERINKKYDIWLFLLEISLELGNHLNKLNNFKITKNLPRI